MTHPDNDMEMSPSWSRAHDWKSCNRQKRFESSNLSISAKEKPAEMRGFSLFLRVFGIFGLCVCCSFFAAFAIKVHRKNTGKYRKVPPAELLRLGHMVVQIVDDIPEQLLFHRFIVDLVAGTVVQGNGNVL